MPLQARDQCERLIEDADAAFRLESTDPDADTYEKLFERVREYNETRDARALAVPHHPAEATFAFDFSAIDYDDVAAPLAAVYGTLSVAELTSAHRDRWPGKLSFETVATDLAAEPGFMRCGTESRGR